MSMGTYFTSLFIIVVLIPLMIADLIHLIIIRKLLINLCHKVNTHQHADKYYRAIPKLLYFCIYLFCTLKSRGSGLSRQCNKDYVGSEWKIIYTLLVHDWTITPFIPRL